MARINIEDSLRDDKRFISCCVALNSKIKALGWWIELATIAQSYWKQDMGLIPEQVYAWHKFPKCFLESGLVEKRESGYYLKGSERNFAWIFSCVENGKKGGRPAQDTENKEDTLTDGVTHGNPAHNPLPLPLPLPLPKKKKKNTYTNVVVLEIHKQIAERWNKMATNSNCSISKVRVTELESRVGAMNEALERYPDFETWDKIIHQAPQDPFRRGETGGNWKVNFEWLFQCKRNTEIKNYQLMLEEYESQNQGELDANS